MRLLNDAPVDVLKFDFETITPSTVNELDLSIIYERLSWEYDPVTHRHCTGFYMASSYQRMTGLEVNQELRYHVVGAMKLTKCG